MLTGVQTPPFGESVLSNGLIALQWQVLKSSAIQVEGARTQYLEIRAGMLRDQVTQENQFYSDVTEFLDLIESHRPLKAHEANVRDAANMMAQFLPEKEAATREVERILAKIKNRRSTKNEEGVMDNSGTTNISDAIGGTDPLGLMIL